MPPSSWDISTFENQQRDVEEIDTALPLLDIKRNELLKRQSKLEQLSSGSNHDSPQDDEQQNPTAELQAVTNELEDVELQRRGRLLLARECEEANRRMLEDVSVEFLTKGEREQLGALRLKLSRILFQYGGSE